MAIPPGDGGILPFTPVRLLYIVFILYAMSNTTTLSINTNSAPVMGKNFSMAHRADSRPCRQQILYRLADSRQGPPRSFFIAEHFEEQKTISHHVHCDVMVPTQKTAAFVMIQAEFLFLLLIILLHSPSDFCHAHQAAQASLRRQVGKPELAGFLLVSRPFNKQPLVRLRTILFFPAMRWLHPDGGKT